MRSPLVPSYAAAVAAVSDPPDGTETTPNAVPDVPPEFPVVTVDPDVIALRLFVHAVTGQ
jgi:hypothetical protein